MTVKVEMKPERQSVSCHCGVMLSYEASDLKSITIRSRRGSNTYACITCPVCNQNKTVEPTYG